MGDWINDYFKIRDGERWRVKLTEEQQHLNAERMQKVAKQYNEGFTQTVRGIALSNYDNRLYFFGNNGPVVVKQETPVTDVGEDVVNDYE